MSRSRIRVAFTEPVRSALGLAAERAGVSLSAFVSMAVREYLDRRTGPPAPSSAPARPLFGLFPEGLIDHDPIRLNKDGMHLPGGQYSAYYNERVPAAVWRPFAQLVREKGLPLKWVRDGVPAEHVEFVRSLLVVAA